MQEIEKSVCDVCKGNHYFIDEDGDEVWESVSHVDGFGKLQHQLGVLAAIAYLDFNDFSK